MPSLYELEDDDVDIEEDFLGENAREEAEGTSSGPSEPPVAHSRPDKAQIRSVPPTKPQSTSAIPSTKPFSSRPMTVKPKSTQTEVITSNSVRVSKESQQCPICGRTLDTDNQGLNSHIDFCLSRGAIRQAQVETIPVKKHHDGKSAQTSKGKTRAKKR